jgi:predicted acylesterase/phospholipase RssA
MLASARKTAQVKKQADLYFSPPVQDFGLLEFKALDRIVDAGYRYALKRLDTLEKNDYKKNWQQ